MSKRFKAPAALALVGAFLCAVAFGAPTPAVADTAAQLQAKLDTAQNKLDSLYEQAEQISEQLNGTKVQLQETNAKIDQANSDIAQTEKDIEAKKAELAERQSHLSAKVAQDYKNGNVSFLSIVLNATSFDDFVSRIHYADKVSEKQASDIDATKQLQAELNDKSIELTAQKQQLEQQKAQQEQLQADQESQQAQLDAQVSETQSYVNGLDQEVKDKLAEEQEAARAQQEAEANAAREAANAALASSSSGSSGGSSGSSSSGNGSSTAPSGSTGSRPAAGSTPSGSNPGSGLRPSGSGGSSSSVAGSTAQRQAVIDAAWSMVGGSYIYGAYDPANRTFDCSGLTMYCFSKAGISLPHQSEAQKGYIRNFVPLSQLQPGDLVWKSGHVGIYVGNGQMIHASNPTRGIIVGPMTWGMVGGGWPA